MTAQPLISRPWTAAAACRGCGFTANRACFRPDKGACWWVEAELCSHCTRPWEAAPGPIPMVLYCPRCDLQHIDAPDPARDWANPPHRSHLCAGCGHVWRPADVATVGVAALETMGKRDSPPVTHRIDWRLIAWAETLLLFCLLAVLCLK